MACAKKHTVDYGGQQKYYNGAKDKYRAGETVEARVDNPPRRTNVGDRLTIKYLPEKPYLVVAVKEENGHV